MIDPIREWWKCLVLRAPLVLPAILSLFGVLLVDLGGWWFVLVFAGLYLSFLGGWRCFVLCLVCGGLGGGLHEWRLRGQEKTRDFLGDRVNWELVVDGETSLGKSGREVMCVVRGGEANGERVFVRLPWMDDDLFAGDVIILDGVVRAPRVAMNFGVMNEGEWLHREGIDVVLEAHEVSLKGEVDKWWVLERWAIQIREWIGRRLILGLPEADDEGVVIKAMFLGEKPNSSRELMDDFRLSGTVHVFAVSGLHVMMMGGFVALVLRFLGLPTWGWVYGAVLVMFAYALVTGMNPPAMRASVMGGVFMCGWALVRKPVLANSLAVGALVAIFWNGHVVFKPGFQLSFGVLVSIVLFTSLWMRLMRWLVYADPFLPRALYGRWQEFWLWSRQRLAGSVTVAASAWMGSTPLMFWHFGIVTPVSVLASLPLVFLVFCILGVSCISLLVGSFWDGGAMVLNRWNGFQANGARWCAGKFADVEGGHFLLKEWASDERVVIYAMPRGGGCSYLGIGGGVLLDGGDRDGFYRDVWPSLRRYGARLDSIVATHGDSRHVGGLEALMEMNLDVRQGLVTVDGGRSYERLLDKMKSAGVTSVRARRGDRIPLSEGCNLEIIYAGDSGAGSADERCMVLRLHWRGQRILFTGDAGYFFEKWAISENIDVGADVLVMGKERRDVSGMSDFISLVNPRFVVVHDVSFPQGEARNSEWYGMLERMGLIVYRQEVCGGVMMEIKDGSLVLKTAR